VSFIQAEVYALTRVGAERDVAARLLTTPALAIFGSNDPLVPVQASIARLQETAEQTTRPQQIAVFPGADHRLQAGASPAPGYLTCLSTWCREPRPPP
jgi:pimeloyl-ACP methyl ester carboxylesterase